MRNDSTITSAGAGATATQNNISEDNRSHCTGTLQVIGIGPGNPEFMTPEAREAILQADRVVGYITYLDLIKDLVADKVTVGTGMMQEVDRCQQAVDLAVEGYKVVVVSSGDPGVYGMAGLVIELANKVAEEKRPPVHMCAEGDMVIALYNPRSKKRVTHLDEVRELVLQHRDLKTPVGIVQKAGRVGQHIIISDLEHFHKEEIDMQTLVIIGNSQTYVENGKIITPRGYKL